MTTTIGNDELSETGGGDANDIVGPAGLRKRTTGNYRTGQCGGVVIDGLYYSNREERHALCRLATPNAKGDVCSCPCHFGHKPWETPTAASIAPARKLTKKPAPKKAA